MNPLRLWPVLLLGAVSLHAQSWNFDGDGNWSNAANWTPAAVPGGVGVSVTFGDVLTADRLISLDGNRTVGELIFDSPHAYTLQGNTLTFDVAAGSAGLVVHRGAPTISSALTLADPLLVTQNSAGTLTLSGVVSGTQTLTKAGTGTLRLTANNTFTGLITLNAGRLQVGADAHLGNTNNGITFNGGTLRAEASFTTSANRVLTFGAGGGTMEVDAARTLTLAASNNRLTGAGTFTRTGDGTLVIQNSNNMTGNVVLAAGVTRINNRAALGTGAGATVTLQNGAELEANWGDGTNFQPTLIFDNGVLRRISSVSNKAGFQAITVTGVGSIIQDGTGNASGFLTIDGLMTVNAGATLNLVANNTREVRLGGNQNITVGTGATLTTSGDGFVAFGSGSGRLIVGSGTTASESLVRLDATVTANNATRLRVNGTGLGGLRLEGLSSAVNILASDTRLNQIQGTGGTLTIAYSDSATRDFTAASNAAAASSVRLGFGSADGSLPVYNLNADHANWRGLVVVSAARVNLNAAQGNFAEGITVNGGTLALGASEVIGNTTAFSLGGGTFATQGYSETLGALTLTGDSVIHMGSAVSGSTALAFADSSALAWSGTLRIEGYFESADTLRFGVNSSGLTAAQVDSIRFWGPGPDRVHGVFSARIDADGYVLPYLYLHPVPEAATWWTGAGLLLLGAGAWVRRRWLSASGGQ